MHNDYFWHDAYSDYPVVECLGNKQKALLTGEPCIKIDIQSLNPKMLKE